MATQSAEQWESISFPKAGGQPAMLVRLKVFGGWLVFLDLGAGASAPPVFVPDPGYHWDPSKPQVAQQATITWHPSGG